MLFYVGCERRKAKRVLKKDDDDLKEITKQS